MKEFLAFIGLLFVTISVLSQSVSETDSIDTSGRSWSSLLNADFTSIKHGTVLLNAHHHSATLVPQGKRQ